MYKNQASGLFALDTNALKAPFYKNYMLFLSVLIAVKRLKCINYGHEKTSFGSCFRKFSVFKIFWSKYQRAGRV